MRGHNNITPWFPTHQAPPSFRGDEYAPLLSAPDKIKPDQMLHVCMHCSVYFPKRGFADRV